MKKLRIFTVALCAMALAMGGTSCKKEKENNIQSGDRMVIGAGINQGGDGQKTHLGENGDKVDILWSKGDSFMLYAGESTDGQTFTIKGEGGATTADFEGAAPGSAPYYAFYPSDEVTRNSEYEFTYTLPKEVEYETLPDHAGPMIGYSKDGSSAMFTAATPALYLSLTGDVKVSKVELTDKNDAKLDGTLTATFNVVNDEVTIITSTVTGGTSSKLTVTMKNGIQLSETPVVFSFPIPVGVFNGDNSAEIVVTYEGGSKTITGGITGGAQLGVAYGKAAEIKATTLPTGALPGLFTVSDNGTPDDTSDDVKVYFSKGNLYYDGSKFNFEANQYGSTPASDGESWDIAHVSHFYWSEDADKAISMSYNDEDADVSDVFFTNANSFTVNVGGAEQTGWRTLSTAEWQYLFNTRQVNGGTGSGKSYSLNITYGGKMGLVLYPDDYTGSALSESVESLPEGVVFLPAAGERDGDMVLQVGLMGFYWSSSTFINSNGFAYRPQFESEVFPYNIGSRCYGSSVRLVSEK